MKCLVDMKLFNDDEICYNMKAINATLDEKKDYKILIFDLDNIKNMYKIYDNGCILYRENNEFKFKLDTIKNESTYLLKEVNNLFDIAIENCEYKNLNNKIIIQYQLETDDHLKKIEVTIGGLK